MSFFEQQVDNLKNQVNFAENVKMGLRQQKDYSSRARQLSASMKWIKPPNQLRKYENDVLSLYNTTTSSNI